MKARWQRIAKPLVLAVIVATLGYTVLAVMRFYDAESQFLSREAESRRRARLVWDIHEATTTLTENGAEDLANCKGACPAVFDLSRWHGTDRQLRSLLTIARLPELRTSNNAMYLKLGPTITSNALPILRELKNLRRIELNDAKLSVAEVRDLMAALPDCTIGEVSWNALFPPTQRIDEPSVGHGAADSAF